MTKTNKRRRVASVLLALVMLLSLMPGLELPAHAFWDDYDTGGDCPNCDHYHWVRICATASSAPLTATTIAGLRPIATTAVCAWATRPTVRGVL